MEAAKLEDEFFYIFGPEGPHIEIQEPLLELRGRSLDYLSQLQKEAEKVRKLIVTIDKQIR